MFRMRGRLFTGILALCCVWGPVWLSADSVRAYGEFVEPGFPYIATTLDAREAPGSAIDNNLIVRGVVVFLGHDTYACYDKDLARLALTWKGAFMDYKSMASHSYYNQGKKNQGGQDWVCRPLGESISAMGLYPGGGTGEPSFEDPRPAGPDPREIGRGAMPDALGRWEGLHVLGDSVVVRYRIGATPVREQLKAQPSQSGGQYWREFQVGPHSESVHIVLGESLVGRAIKQNRGHVVSMDARQRHQFQILAGNDTAALEVFPGGKVGLVLSPSARLQFVRVLVANGVPESDLATNDGTAGVGLPNVVSNARRHWEEAVVTEGTLGGGNGYVVDDVVLPLDNPWRRQVRSADLVFLPDGSAVMVTFDGDLWHLSNLDASLSELRWERIASGLHEPQSINYRDGKLFVYTRGGLMRLHDLNRDGEIDYYETFTARFTQTAETREFPNDAIVTADGAFLLAKPGQQAKHQGEHNGSILYVSPDGREIRPLATGFRQPYLGYRASDGRITVADQQGHWIPTSPVHVLGDGRFYGFRPSTEVVAPGKSVSEPLCWIPHRVVQSATSQVWLDSDKLGPLSGKLVCLDYYRANLMVIHDDQQEVPVQGAASAWELDLDLPVLKGDIRNEDGWLYLTGFQIWGSKAKPWSGIRRVRYTGGDVAVPTEVRSVKEGLVLEFYSPLDVTDAVEVANYHVGRWNYRRTKSYGSGHYKLNGEPGTEVVGVSEVVVSSDGRSVLLVIPDLKPAMQMEVVYRVLDRSGRTREGAAYATIHELQSVDLSDLGFSPSTVARALERKPALDTLLVEDTEVSAARGHQLYQQMGCMACHSLDGSTAGRSGPTLKGVFGSRREFAKGRAREANEAYLRDSILNPPLNVLKAFATSDIGMPSYEGVLSEAQVESLVAFIKTL